MTSLIGGCQLLTLDREHNPRGSLCVFEIQKELGFAAARSFLISDVPAGDTRGQHAHRVCLQALSAIVGTVHVEIDDGRDKQRIHLDSPGLVLYIPTLVWSSQTYVDASSVLVVWASHPYDEAEYIRNYASFLEATSR